MKDFFKLIGAALLIILVALTARSVVMSYMGSPVESTSEESYMGVTKQDYLDTVSNKGQDTGALCAYTYLIDNFGIEETYKMDSRADKNPEDIDQRIYDAIDRCQ